MRWRLLSTWRIDEPGEIWQISDSPTNSLPIVDDQLSLRPLAVALDQPRNVGVTALTLRRKPQDRVAIEAFIEVGYANQPADSSASLWIVVDGIERETRRIETGSGTGSARLVVDLSDISHGGLLEVRVESEDDRLVTDNAAFAVVPGPTTANVAWFTAGEDQANVFTWLALKSLGSGSGIVSQAYTPDNWPLTQPADVYLFEGWVPDELPETGTVVIIDPPQAVGPVSVTPIGTLILSNHLVQSTLVIRSCTVLLPIACR